MPKFRSVNDLTRYIRKNSAAAISNNKALERALASKMSKAVEKYVYDKYTPRQYERRGEQGGLSDERNMQITQISIRNNQLYVQFENLTKGQDSLSGENISDLIEGGEGTNGKSWSKQGEWSNPRPFVAPLSEELKTDPKALISALKEDLRSKGFKIRG